jgi:hypothetical protein
MGSRWSILRTDSHASRVGVYGLYDVTIIYLACVSAYEGASWTRTEPIGGRDCARAERACVSRRLLFDHDLPKIFLPCHSPDSLSCSFVC